MPAHRDPEPLRDLLIRFLLEFRLATPHEGAAVGNDGRATAIPEGPIPEGTENERTSRQ